VLFADVQHHHLTVGEWLIQTGCPWDVQLLADAMASFHTEFDAWGTANGMSPVLDPDYYDAIGHGGNVVAEFARSNAILVLNWTRQHGLLSDDDISTARQAQEGVQ
jgi:hypothetical protein